MGIITAIKRTKRNADRCSVFVDDTFAAACPIDVAALLGLKKGLELTAELELRLRKEDRRIVLKQKAYRFATYKPRTRRQVEQHLQKLDATDEELSEVMLWLEDFRLVDDRQYAQNFLAASLDRKPLSPAMARRTLAAKGIETSIIDDCIQAAYGEDEIQNAALKVAEKKLASLQGAEAEKRDKLIRFLQYRGYPWNVIRVVVEQTLSSTLAVTLVVVLTIVLTQAASAQDSSCDKRRLPPSINSYQPTTQAVLGPDGKLYVDRKYHPDNAEGTADHDETWVASRIAGNDFGAPTRERFTTFTQPDVVFNFTDDGLHALIVGPYRIRGKDTIQCFAIASRRATTAPFHQLDVVEIPGLDHLGQNFFGHLSSNRQVLIVSIDNGGGTDMDLYVSHRCNGNWSALVPLGSAINTVGFEGGPWLSDDLQTLYFSSNARDDRLGMSDLYMTRRLGSSWTAWSTPINLGRCINTQQDETALSLSGTAGQGKATAFISSWDVESSRNGIYSIILPKHLSPLPYCRYTQVVTDAVSGDTITDATIVVTDSNDAGACLKHTYGINNDSRLIAATLLQGSRQRIVTQAPGYARHEQTIAVQQLDSTVGLHLTVQLFSTTRPLASIYFERDSFELSDSAKGAIQSLLQSYDLRQLRFDVAGYTDAVGTLPHNATLSELRAAAVADMLRELGLPKERIISIGRGVEDVGGVTSMDENPSSRRVDIYAAEP